MQKRRLFIHLLVLTVFIVPLFIPPAVGQAQTMVEGWGEGVRRPDTDTFEPNDSFAQAYPITPSTIQSYISHSSDLDYFSFGANAGDTIDITLFDLPADYHLCLFDPNQLPLGTCSENTGTSSEWIQIQATSSGIHYALVFGNQAAYDANQPYSLKLDDIPLPDLIINDVWYESGDFCYQVQNVGKAAAPAGHLTEFRIDGVYSGSDLIDVNLVSGERLNRCFNIQWQCSVPEDTIKLHADEPSSVAESDETNNHIEELWQCDTQAPKITEGPTVSNITQSSAIIEWKTDEASDSTAKYGRQAGKYKDEETDSSQQTDHKITLNNLVSGTTYHYMVESADSISNTVMSKDYFFETASPNDTVAPNFSFFQATGHDLPLQFTALVSDNLEVRRVEFYIDGELAQTDYSAPFQFRFHPQYLRMTRLEFFKEHTILARAFDRFGNSTDQVVTYDPPHFCTVGEHQLRTPYDGYPILVFDDTTPPGTEIEFWAEASQTEWTYGRLPGFPEIETVSGTAVARMEFWWSDGISNTLVYSSTDPTLIHTYDWDASGLAVGEYTAKAFAYSDDGCVQTDFNTVVITSTRPDLRPAMRTTVDEGSYYTVRLRIENEGHEPATLTVLADYLSGFQSITEDLPGYHVHTSYDADTQLGRTRLIFDPPMVIPAFSDVVVEYKAVPILYQGVDEYGIGVGDSDIYYEDPAGDLIHETFSVPLRGVRFDLEVADLIDNSDYLLVTNPRNLYALYDAASVDILLSKMAELATLRNGVLGYYFAFGSRLTSFGRDDMIAVGDVIAGDKEEILLLEREENRVRMYSARGRFDYEIEHYDLHNDDAIAAGNVMPMHDLGGIFGEVHPSWEEIVIADGNGSHLGNISFYQYWPRLDDFLVLGSASFSSSFSAGDGLAVGNVTGASNPEVVIANGDTGTVEIYERAAHDEDVWSLVDNFLSSFDYGDQLAIGDVTRGTDEEIVIATTDGWIYIYDGAGVELESFDADFSNDDSLTVGDVRGDDKAEIIFNSNGTDTVHVYGINPAGGLSHYDMPMYSHSDDMMVAGDVMGYGKDEFMIARGRTSDSNHRYAGLVEINFYAGTESPGDMYSLDLLLDEGHEWAAKLTPDWASEGYLLLVGETEIIPTFSCSHDDRRIRYADRYYASTRGHSWNPNLAIGRIVGDTASRMTITLQKSIDLARGLATWENSSAVSISGYDACFSGSCDDIDFSIERGSVADRIALKGFTVSEEDMVAPQAPGVSDDDFKQDRRDEFFTWVEDQDLIYLAGHGNSNVWDLVSSGHVRNDFVPGTGSPLIYAASCLTSLYPAGAGLAEAFLQSGASTYVGATEVSYGDYVPILARMFVNRLNIGQTVGDTMRDTKNDYVSGGRDSEQPMRRYHGAIHHLFGDPKLPLASTALRADGPADPNQQRTPTLAGPLASTQITVPDYEVSTIEGQHQVDIPGGGTLLTPGQPMVPDYTVVITYPHGIQVQNVTLLTRTNMITATGLNIPTTTLDEYGGIAIQPSLRSAESPELWPDTDFEWSVVLNPDGSTSLNITLFPFYYNQATTNVRFYRDYTFDINYVSSEVEITGVVMDQTVFEQGQAVAGEIYLLNSAQQADDFILEAVVTNEDGEVIEGLMLRTLEDMVGLVTFAAEWGSTGFDPGVYLLEVTVRDTEGALLDQETRLFTLGVAAGAIVDFAAGPAEYSVGETVTSSLTFENVGTVSISATAVIRVLNDADEIIEEFWHDEVLVAPGASLVVDDNWDSTGTPPADYSVAGYVAYNGMTAGPVSLDVSSLRRVYLPLVIR